MVNWCFTIVHLRFIEEPLDEVYDWSADVMSNGWNAKAAMKKLKAMPDALICDALLNQDIFSGIGNIIKNEVLFRVKVQPLSLVGKIPAIKWDEILNELVNYSYQFLEWRKRGEFQQHWPANARKLCPRDKVPFIKAYLGKIRAALIIASNARYSIPNGLNHYPYFIMFFFFFLA